MSLHFGLTLESPQTEPCLVVGEVMCRTGGLGTLSHEPKVTQPRVRARTSIICFHIWAFRVPPPTPPITTARIPQAFPPGLLAPSPLGVLTFRSLILAPSNTCGSRWPRTWIGSVPSHAWLEVSPAPHTLPGRPPSWAIRSDQEMERGVTRILLGCGVLTLGTSLSACTVTLLGSHV